MGLGVGGASASASVIASSVTEGHGHLRATLHLVARDPCKRHHYTHSEEKVDGRWKDRNHACRGGITGETTMEDDLFCAAHEMLYACNMLATAESVKDVTNTARSISANSAASAVYIVAGINAGVTSALFADYALVDGVAHTDYKSNGSYAQAGTVNAPSTNTQTITATITNVSGSPISYNEIGMAITVATWQFLLTHNAPLTGGPFNVSNNGTLAGTVTLTWT